ncbi:MAG: hypothetical protein HDR88_01220 [Bacteroides sp.]|nr:hypothetical protein [Bacteroides sp.]
MIKLRPMIVIAAYATFLTGFPAITGNEIMEFSPSLKPEGSRRHIENFKDSQNPYSNGKSTLKKNTSREAIPGIITDLPKEAVYFDYDRDGIGFYYNYGSVYSEYLVARQSEIYVCGSDVYLKNPIIDYPTDTYIKGEINEKGMIFNLPQPISAYEWNGDYYYTYASMLELTENPETGNLTYVAPDENTLNQLVFYRDEENENKFVMENEDGEDRILGTIDDYMSWTGYGEYNVVYTPFNTPLITPPADIEIEHYIIAWKTASARMVNIGISGSDCYIQGLSTYAPEGWIKGSYSDGKITLKSNQYVGINYDWDMRSRLFFKAAHLEAVWNEWYQDYYDMPVADEEMVLTYDPETRSYSSDSIIGFTTGDAANAQFYEYYANPVLRFQPDDISLVPAKPIFKEYYPLESIQDAQCIHFIIPDLNVDGYLLPHDNLYYRVLVNGEPYVWERTEYPTIPEETMEWMPVDQDDWWDFMTHDDYISIVVYVAGMSTLGVQSCFYDGENRYESEVMSFGVDDPLYVEEIKNHGEIKYVKYFDLSGYEIAQPSKGIYIKKAVFDDGTEKTSKIAVR